MGELTVDFRSLNNTPLPDEAPEEPDEPEEPEEALHKSTQAEPFHRFPIVRSTQPEPVNRLREETAAKAAPEYRLILILKTTFFIQARSAPILFSLQSLDFSFQLANECERFHHSQRSPAEGLEGADCCT